MAVTFSDNFNRADSTSIGADWTEVTQDVAISSNRLINNTTNKAGHLAVVNSITPSSADYDIQCISRAKNVAGNVSTSGVVGRYTDSTHFYHARAGLQSGGGLQLYKFNAGATLLGSYAFTYNMDTDYTVKLTMSGTTIKAFLDGVERISVTDSDLASVGLGGVRIFPDNSGTLNVGDAFIDDFQIEEAGASIGGIIHPLYLRSLR